MLQQDEPDDYVVGTGETYSVRELCEVAFERGRARLPRLRRAGREVLPAGRGRPARRRPVEGARAAGLGRRRCASTQLVADDGRRRSRAAPRARRDATRARHGRQRVRRAVGRSRALLDRGWARHRPPVSERRARTVRRSTTGAPRARCAGEELDVARRRTHVGARRRRVRRRTSILHLAGDHVTCRTRCAIPGAALRGERRRHRATARRGRARCGARARSIPSCSSSAARSSTGVTRRREMPLDETAEQRPLTRLRGHRRRRRRSSALQAYRSDGRPRGRARAASTTAGAGQAAQLSAPGARRARARAAAPRAGALTIGNSDIGARLPPRARRGRLPILRLLERGAPGEVYNVVQRRRASACAQLAESRACSASVSLPRFRPIRRSSRPVDVPVLDRRRNAKLRRATGWTPRHTRDDIIDDLIHAATH